MATLHRANVWSSATPVDPIKYYEVGGSNLDPATSTADFYHMHGLYWFRPYDLRKWGSHGAAREAALGYRYVWSCSADHPTGQGYGWRDSTEFMVGFSNDPGVFPETLTPIIPLANAAVNIFPGAPSADCSIYELAWLAYNPEDADGLYFYLCGEGIGNGITHTTMLWRSSDLLTWTAKVMSHYSAIDGPYTSFQVTRRIGAGSWQSHGPGYDPTVIAGYSYFGHFKWTSTDGLTYTQGSTSLDYYRHSDGTMYTHSEIVNPPHAGVYNPAISVLNYGVGDEFSISGQRSWVSSEHVGVWEGTIQRPQYISIVPADSDGNVLTSPAPNRIADYGTRNFPGQRQVQAAPYLVEDGILHIYVAHGFFDGIDTSVGGYPYCVKQNATLGNGVLVTFSGTVSLPPIRPCTVCVWAVFSGTLEKFCDNGAGVFVGSRIVSSSINYTSGAWSVTFNAAPQSGSDVRILYIEDKNTFTELAESKQLGGGLVEQFHDYWTHIIDATAAASHAPVGVTASCAAGVVTISWKDALPHQNYRVARGTTLATQGTAIGDVTGLTTTNSPGTGLFYYRVTTLNAGTPTGYRIVPVYSSGATVLANKHIQRVQADGGDITKINVPRLEAAISFLTARDWMKDLLFWASPDWGVKESGGHIVKVYCLGTTRLPRGGDLTFTTSTTTYSATGLNGNCATFVNANTNSFGYFGGNRFNPIRRKRQITVATMYERTQTSADITFAGLKTSNGTVENNYNGTTQPGLSFSHLAGTPGTVEFILKDDQFGIGTRQNTATVAASSASYNIAIGTFTGTEMKAYHNGSGGTANTNYDPDPYFFRDTVLAGARGSGVGTNGRVWPILGVGSKSAHYLAPLFTTSTLTPGTYTFPANEAQFEASDIFVMGRGVSGSDAALLTAMFNNFATGTTTPIGYVAPLKLRLRA